MKTPYVNLGNIDYLNEQGRAELHRLIALHARNGCYVYGDALLPDNKRYQDARWSSPALLRFCQIDRVTSLKEAKDVEHVYNVSLNGVGRLLIGALIHHTHLERLISEGLRDGDDSEWLGYGALSGQRTILREFIADLLKTPVREPRQDLTAPSPALDDLAAYHGLRSGLQFKEQDGEQDQMVHDLLNGLAPLALAMLANLYDWPHYFQTIESDEGLHLFAYASTTEVALMIRAMVRCMARQHPCSIDAELAALGHHDRCISMGSYALRRVRDPQKRIEHMDTVAAQLVNNAWVARWADGLHDKHGADARFAGYDASAAPSRAFGAPPDCMGAVRIAYSDIRAAQRGCSTGYDRLLKHDIVEAAEQILAVNFGDASDRGEP